MTTPARWSPVRFLLLALALLPGCADGPGRGRSAVIIGGVAFPTEAPVVTWNEPGGYDAHLERCFFTPDRELPEKPSRGCDVPRRYGERSTDGLSPEIEAQVRAHGWDLEATRAKVDQFVIHYDVCWTSRQCFKVLHDLRGLSVHFLLDLDGTVYQTLDLADRGRHATIANDRSIGIEIANPGAYEDREELERWYADDGQGGRRIRLEAAKDAASGLPPGFIARPWRQGLFEGSIHGRRVMQYDFTDAQYESLSKLVQTLCEALPRLSAQVPRAADGRILDRVLTREEFAATSGLLGHWHIQTNKVDPGPAFDWQRVLSRTAVPAP